MKLYGKLNRLIAPVTGIVLFIALLVWFFTGVGNAGKASSERQLEAVKASVENGITLCYSIEGAYPESLGYLTENYGVNYNKERYIVHYECFAANIRPNVTVVEKE